MNSEEKKSGIDLNEAKQSFVGLMESLSATDQQKFLAFIAREWRPESTRISSSDAESDACDISGSPFRMLNSIISHVRQKVPFNGMLSSENIITPLIGENSDCDPNVTLHIDEFLYSDEDVDELVDNGQLQTHYCLDCGSKNTRLLIYISHSMCLSGLLYIFNALLADTSLEDKTILDIGSRIGAVLYGAYVFTGAKRIVGVEMNEEFCDIQNDVIRKFEMGDRISVVHKRIEQAADIVEQSDVIIINNAFEFYLPHNVQIDIWRYLRATVKSGTLLITRPPVETTFRTLNIDIPVEKWLKPRAPHFEEYAMLMRGKEKDPDILCYEVL